MPTTLSQARVSSLLAAAAAGSVAPPHRASDAGPRVSSVLYGGAHLFTPASPAKLAKLAEASFESYAGDASTFGALVGLTQEEVADDLFARVRAKLHDAPVEAMVIDFEDGYGWRPDAEEDRDAERTAEALAEVAGGARAPVIGLRVKPFGVDAGARGARTLDLFLTTLARATRGTLPRGFTVTLPKVSVATEVGALATMLAELEGALGLEEGSVGVELMIETPLALVAADGTVPIRRLVHAGAGRVSAVHLGAYDLTSACGVAAPDQQLDHPLCDLARATMQLALASTDVAVVDGATTELPLPPHRAPASAAEREENELAVRSAWHLHAIHVRRALATGIHAGWDLHPAQLPARHGAVFAFYREARAAMTARLARFVEQATRATRIGQVFDDAATGQGLLVFFLRGLACGALDESDLAATGLTREEIATRSFAKIVAGRAS